MVNQMCWVLYFKRLSDFRSLIMYVHRLDAAWHSDILPKTGSLIAEGQLYLHNGNCCAPSIAIFASVEMKSVITLNQIAIGGSATISVVRLCSYASRLNEMGIIPGRTVKVLHQAPFSGPFAVGVGSQTIALRPEEAAQIEVSLDA